MQGARAPRTEVRGEKLGGLQGGCRLGGSSIAFCKAIAQDSAFIVEEMESPASSSDRYVLATLEVHMQQTDHRAVR